MKVTWLKLENKHLYLYYAIQKRGFGRGCSDLDPAEREMLTAVEWQEFTKAYDDWNGETEKFSERTNFVLYDFQIMSFVTDILVSSYMWKESK